MTCLIPRRAHAAKSKLEERDAYHTHLHTHLHLHTHMHTPTHQSSIIILITCSTIHALPSVGSPYTWAREGRDLPRDPAMHWRHVTASSQGLTQGQGKACACSMRKSVLFSADRAIPFVGSSASTVRGRVPDTQPGCSEQLP